MTAPCTIALTPDGLFALTIPSPSGGEQTIEIPFTIEGFLALRRILIAREVAPKAKLGTDAEPTQSLVQEWLRHHAPKPKEVDLSAIEIEI